MHPRFATAALLALALTACSRSPFQLGPPSEADPAGGDSAGAAEGPEGDAANDPSRDPCAPNGVAARLPPAPPGWAVEIERTHPYERLRGRMVGFTGRVFRRGRVCVVVGEGHPVEPEEALERLAEEEGAERRTVEGLGSVVVRAAPEADQVTAWFLGGPRLSLLRAWGSTDPEALAPFLEAAAASGAANPEPACAPGDPLLDPYDPRALYGPPSACTLPPEDDASGGGPLPPPPAR